jgi:hypothetical protein
LESLVALHMWGGVVGHLGRTGVGGFFWLRVSIRFAEYTLLVVEDLTPGLDTGSVIR